MGGNEIETDSMKDIGKESAQAGRKESKRPR